MIAVVTFYALKTLQIIWIDFLLSGDNAVVIALACRSLPERGRRRAVWFGAGAAVALRVVFAFIVVSLLSLPGVKVVGGALLVWIAVKLLLEDRREEKIAPADSIWRAVWTIAMADALMSLDNVLAIAGAAHGDFWLMAFGLALSAPLIVFGASMIMRLLDGQAWLLWAGGALLGWVAGEMIAGDRALAGHLRALSPHADRWAAAFGAILVTAISGAIKWAAGSRRK